MGPFPKHTSDMPRKKANAPSRLPAALAALFAGPSTLERTEDRLDYQWFRPMVAGIPQERWAAEARGRVVLAEGEYSLRTISDDGIRVWVDDALVIDRFDPHGSEVDYAALTPGAHELRVQYFQIGGWAELRVDVLKGSARSPGSAGPH